MIDSHYHFEPSLVTAENLIASMDGAGVDQTVLMATLCPPLSLPSFADYVMPVFRRAIHADGGVFQKLMVKVYKHNVRGGLTVDLLGNRYEVNPRPDNDAVAKAVLSHPDRFCGLTFVNPEGPADPLAEVERFCSGQNMIGVKAHPYWHDYPVSRLEDVAALCAERHLPILIHLGTGRCGDFRFLPERFPDLTVIYAHIGIPFAAAVCDYARSRRNVYVDLSAPTYVDVRAARAAVRRAGADKCLFGSDGPYLHVVNQRYDYTASLSILENLPVTEAERDRIAGGNFREVYGVPAGRG